jgi:hypothetical protein
MCVPIATKGSSFIVKTRKILEKIFLMDFSPLDSLLPNLHQQKVS